MIHTQRGPILSTFKNKMQATLSSASYLHLKVSLSFTTKGPFHGASKSVPAKNLDPQAACQVFEGL